MTKMIFIEGVSGVGKSTMVQALQNRLRAFGYTVKSYLEFDFANPIDFYGTAYVPNEQYENLCQNHREERSQIRRYSVSAGAATLVRYSDGDTPLFSEGLMGTLREMEFSYRPVRPIPLAAYSKAFEAVWEDFDRSYDRSVDFYIFDGSLLHHPLNDLIRNYDASKAQAAAHVKLLLGCLKDAHTGVFYLFVEDVAGQLRLARQNRRQPPPDPAAVAFWEKRRDYDAYVLQHAVSACQMLNVTKDGYEAVMEQIAAACGL